MEGMNHCLLHLFGYFSARYWLQKWFTVGWICSNPWCILFVEWQPSWSCSRNTIGTLRSNDADDNENVKKTIGLISKTTTLHMHHTFLYISYPFLHDYDVKVPNFAFYGERKQATTKFYFSFWAWIWSLEIQLQEGSPTIDKVSG